MPPEKHASALRAVALASNALNLQHMHLGRWARRPIKQLVKVLSRLKFLRLAPLRDQYSSC